MVKLTNREVYDSIMLKLDKFGSPYFTEDWVSIIFNESYIEFVNLAAKEFEQSSKRRADLVNLVKKYSVPAASVIPYNLLSPDPYLLLMVISEFAFTCKTTTSNYKRRVKPITFDSFGVISDDPFNAPTDQFPAYVEYAGANGKEIHVLSKNTPIITEVTYIKSPNRIDISGNPNGVIEMDYPQQIEIIDIAVRKLLQTVESPVLMAQHQIEIPKNE